VTNPFQAQAWATLSAVLQLQGKVDQAYFAAQRAYETDAYLLNAPEIVYRLFHTSFQLGRDTEAARWCDIGRRRFPLRWLFLDCHLAILASADRVEPRVEETWRTVDGVRAIVPAQQRAWVEPRLRMRAAAVLARAGLADSAERVIRAARASAPDDPEMLYSRRSRASRCGSPIRRLPCSPPICEAPRMPGPSSVTTVSCAPVRSPAVQSFWLASRINSCGFTPPASKQGKLYR